MHHARIGTEHLLLGLLREEKGIASRVLRELGLQSGDVVRWVERLSTMQRRSLLLSVDLDLTPRTKQVLELDREDKVTAVRPEDCICCDLCEIRCPDLAIEIIVDKEKDND